MKLNKFNMVSFLIEAALTTRACKLTKTTYRPIVIWHGMGDSCCNPQSIGGFVDYLEELLPNTLIYSLNVSDSDNELIERKNSYFGNINDQVDYVCSRLHDDDLYPQLKDGFNALGFSQGGQFLRAYVERCNDPPVYNLITYGAQHNGVSSIPACAGSDSEFCERMKLLVSSNVYSSFVQNNVIQAQYFKSVDYYDDYLEKSIFLADINNEKETKNPLYKENMLSLNKFVMIKFEEDDMVVPSTSPWFGWVDDFENPLPLNKTDAYKEDWLGLQTMEKQDKLDFLTAPGTHMQIDLEYFMQNVFHPYLDEIIDDDDDDDDNNDKDNNGNDDDDDDDDDIDDDDNLADDDSDSDDIADEEFDYTNNKIKVQKNDEYLDSFFFKVQH